jgi:hypothetical protein
MHPQKVKTSGARLLIIAWQGSFGCYITRLPEHSGMAQVRMVRKGVLQGIVPWCETRRFFTMHLRCKLMEFSIAGRMSQASNCLSNSAALSLLRSWFHASQRLAKTVFKHGQDRNAPHSANTGMAASSILHCTDLNGKGRQEGCNHERPCTETTTVPGPLSAAESASTASNGIAFGSTAKGLMQADKEFLAWMESSAGAAKVGAELKELWRRAAAAAVQKASQSQEGREGLLAALQEVVAQNATLRAQLSTMLQA